VAESDSAVRLQHDLRTPLSVVIGFAELLASDRELTDDQRRDYATRVLNAGVEIRDLIDAAYAASRSAKNAPPPSARS
jgi:signal transduction histidine kinase